MNTTIEKGFLVKSISIENLLNQRQAIIDRVMQAKRLLIEASEIAETARLNFHGSLLSFASHDDFPVNLMDPSPDDIKKRLDRKGWNFLLEESGLKTFMDAEAREKWGKSMQHGEFPELTLENIHSTFKLMHQSRGDMFERGVVNCFRKLSWDYKTNNPFRMGKRIILHWFHNGWGPVISSCNNVDDLIRVMHVLDNKPEPDHRQGTYALCCNAEVKKASSFENDYIHLRWYKKGTAHITFKRADLVDEMNRIIAKHYPSALPAAA